MANPFMRNFMPNGFMPHVRNNADTYLQTGLGLLSGRTGPEQFAMGAQGLLSARQGAQEKAKLNQTMAYLQKINPQLAQAVEAGALSPSDAYKEHLKAQAPGGAAKWSMQPELFRDAEGNYRYGTFSGSGEFKPIDTGDLMPVNPYESALERAKGTATGKVIGEQQATAGQDISKSLQTAQQIDELIQTPGFSQIFGSFDQYRPSWAMGSSGRDALARYNQLKGKAFLEAYSMLKGGGQITEVEGIKAEQAMARLDRAQDEATAKAALNDFKEAVLEGARKLQAAHGGQAVPGPVPTPTVEDPLGIR